MPLPIFKPIFFKASTAKHFDLIVSFNIYSKFLKQAMKRSISFLALEWMMETCWFEKARNIQYFRNRMIKKHYLVYKRQKNVPS